MGMTNGRHPHLDQRPTGRRSFFALLASFIGAGVVFLDVIFSPGSTGSSYSAEDVSVRAGEEIASVSVTGVEPESIINGVEVEFEVTPSESDDYRLRLAAVTADGALISESDYERTLYAGETSVHRLSTRTASEEHADAAGLRLYVIPLESDIDPS